MMYSNIMLVKLVKPMYVAMKNTKIRKNGILYN